MAMKWKERHELIDKIAEASGIARYAFEDAIRRGDMADEQLIKIVQQHLESYSLLKPAIARNRQQQKQYTRAANKRTEEVSEELQETRSELQETKNKLQEIWQDFIDLQNSEIVRLGRWLLDTLSKDGEERRKALSERELVHQSEHSAVIGDMGDAIVGMREISARTKEDYARTIETLEKTNDNLRSQLQAIQEKIAERHGLLEWKRIEKEFRKVS